MTPWISARRADRFESLLDAAQSPGSAGAGGPEPDAELRELVHLVAALDRVEAPAPRPEFLTDLRERLMVEAATTLESTEPDLAARLSLPERNPRRRRRMVAAITGVVLVGTGGTVAFAAQSALPGEGLYPIKILVEKAESSVTFGDASRGDRQLQHAQSRIDEVKGLLEDGSPGALGQVPATLSTFATQSRSAADLLIADYRSSGHESSLRTLRSFALRNLGTLDALDSQVPSTTRDDLVAAARTLVRIDQDVSAACPACSGALADLPGLLQARPIIPTGNGPVAGRDSPAPSATPSRKPSSRPSSPSSGQPPAQQAPDEQVRPTNAPSADPTAGAGNGTGGHSGSGTDKNGPQEPAKGPSKTPSPTPTGAVKGLLETLVGDGQSGEDANPGVVGGLVGGVVGGVGGLLGGLLGGTPPSSTPRP